MLSGHNRLFAIIAIIGLVFADSGLLSAGHLPLKQLPLPTGEITSPFSLRNGTRRIRAFSHPAIGSILWSQLVPSASGINRAICQTIFLCYAQLGMNSMVRSKSSVWFESVMSEYATVLLLGICNLVSATGIFQASFRKNRSIGP